MDKVSFELLLVKDIGEQYQVIGITYSDALNIAPDCKVLRASLYAIEACKKALAENKIITVSKIIEHSEVLPHELIIEAPSDLDRLKQAALNEVLARMHQAIFAMNVIDLMDYLDCYINLLNAGYYITDSNREDKYFKVIEDAQEAEEPAPLSQDASFEDEQKYIEAKQKYDTAQANLATLERYLNCYDNLSSSKSKIHFFTQTRDKIKAAKTEEELTEILKIYKSNLKNYQMVNVVD